MSLVQLIVAVVVVGLVLWLINTFLPIEGKFKQLINVLAGVAVVVYVIVWLLRFAGLG